MNIKYFIAALAAPLLLVTNAQAALIQGPDQITATTSIPGLPGFSDINQIADGVDSDAFPYNGFAGQNGEVGTIRLELDGLYNLTTFRLWNDINVNVEGVDTFQLRFLDASGAIISTTGVLSAPVGQLAEQVFDLGLIQNVKTVNFAILTLLPSAFGDRIEIREVAFNGDEVPLPAAFWFMSAGIAAYGASRKKKGVKA